MKEREVQPGHRIPVGVVEARGSHSPWLMDGLFSTGQGQFSQVGQSVETVILGEQKLSAPDLSIRPIAGTIERHADDRACVPILRHTGRNVGMVMLHRNLREALY